MQRGKRAGATSGATRGSRPCTARKRVRHGRRTRAVYRARDGHRRCPSGSARSKSSRTKTADREHYDGRRGLGLDSFVRGGPQPVRGALDTATMSHSVRRILVHSNWTTFRRRPLLSAEIEPLICDAIGEQCARHAISLLAVGAADDHVHVLFVLPPERSLANVLRLIKGGSSRVAADALQAGPTWQRGYFSLSVSASHEQAVAEYVRNQRARHAERRTHPRFEP
jgi:putative transposase